MTKTYDYIKLALENSKVIWSIISFLVLAAGGIGIDSWFKSDAIVEQNIAMQSMESKIEEMKKVAHKKTEKKSKTVIIREECKCIRRIKELESKVEILEEKHR